MSNRRNAHNQSARIALCGMMAALSVVLLMSGTLIPVLLYVAPLVCGALLLPVMLEFGKGSAWMVWAVTTVLTLLLGADREAAFFYLVIGWYPLVKWRIDKLPSTGARLAAKVALFTVTIGGMYLAMDLILHLPIMEDLGGAVWLALFVVMMLAVMLMFDRLLWPLCILYTNRIKPKLHFLHR